MKQILKNEISYIVKRNKLFKELEEVLERSDYIKVEPDYFEDYDWFTRSNVRVKPSEMVKVIDPLGSVKLLRPDITTNVIRQILPYWEDDSFIKIFYDSVIFRRENGNLNQTRQFGYEVLGGDYITNIIEVVEITKSIFRKFGSRFMLVLGNQNELENIIDKLNLDNNDFNDLKKAIMQKNQVWVNNLLKGKDSIEAKFISNVLSLNGSIETLQMILDKSNDILGKQMLEPIMDIINRTKCDNDNIIQIDLSLLTEFDYYSGVVFQGFIEGVPYSILSGGRYDKLSEKLGKKIVSVGTSFDVLEYVKEVKYE